MRPTQLASTVSRSNMVLIAAMIGLMLYLSLILNVGYYSKSDLLGPVSKFPGIFIPLGVFIGVFVFLATRNEKTSIIIPCAALLLLLLYLIALPVALEPYYIADNYDAPVHMARAVFVAQTGRSSVSADPYFDIQPGVFYATAMFLLVTGVSPDSLTKWFPVLFVALAYLPALLFLGKVFFRSRRTLVLYVCFTLLIAWSGRYHYSGQVYSLPLLILVVGLIVRSIYDEQSATKNSIVALILSTAIIMLHQLIALATFAVLVSTLAWLLVSKERRARIGSLIMIIITFLLSWLAYLMWLTIYTFGDFLGTLTAIFDLLLKEGLLIFIARAITRQDPALQQIIVAKVLFTASTQILSSLVSAYAWAKKNARFGLVLLMMTTVSGIIYLLGFPLGGRAFVERAVLLTGFLTAIGLTFGITTPTRRRLYSLLTVVSLVSLTVAGSALFNSGRNFQFTTYSEHGSVLFVDKYAPDKPGLTGLGDISQEDQVNYATLATGKPKFDVVIFTLHRFIERSYLESSDFNVLGRANQNPNLIKVYSNGVSSIYVVNR